MIQKFNYEKEFYKLDVLDDIIKDECDENDNKIMIFYVHPLTKDYLINHLIKRQPYIISADVPSEERFKIVQEFEKADSKILI
jgi:succinyl-CoA synthetase alpha subunit